MSLAIYAAPFNENSNNINDSNLNSDIIQEKRQHNKTQKNYNRESFKPKQESFDQNKVNSVLEKLHQKTEEEDEMKDNNNFYPPPKPESSGVERTIKNENMQNMLNQNNLNMYKVLGKAPQPNYDNNDNLDLNNFKANYGDSKSVEDYYKNVLPSYVPQKNINNRPFYNNNNMQINESMYSGTQQDILLQKLNYMINLLEEKQDERTNNVTEEVVLYSFLGIFIIFVVDSFARVGKYVR
jgi:hypothetical protein